MTSMTVQDTYDYVRSYLDSDSTDLPDSLLAVWLAEGSSRVQRTFEPWSFYESSWSLTTSAASAAFTSMDGTDNSIDTVKSVEADLWILRFVPHENAVAKYAWSSATAGSPIEFSTFDSTLYLWPAPSASATYTVRGYRKPNDPLVSESIDLPDEFHPLVAEWMFARAYERQDNDAMSVQKFNGFREGLDMYRRRYTRSSDAGVQILGGNSRNVSAPLGRLAYDWES